jgi:hypothetical protein
VTLIRWRAGAARGAWRFDLAPAHAERQARARIAACYGLDAACRALLEVGR